MRDRDASRTTSVGRRAMTALRCRCVWDDIWCPNDATQEDGLCDWCGVRRLEDLESNPNVTRHAVTGEVLGLGGSREAHVNAFRHPDACWLPNSGRTFHIGDGGGP